MLVILVAIRQCTGTERFEKTIRSFNDSHQKQSHLHFLRYIATEAEMQPRQLPQAVLGKFPTLIRTIQVESYSGFP
jgi:hypothetical protein